MSERGWVLGPPRWRPWRHGPWLRLDRPVGWTLSRVLWIWQVHIRHRAKYKGIFD